jgi:hypothetical protein
MELLLNLIWLLLVVPAFWVWHRASDGRSGGVRQSGPCLLTLGCVLMLLFPVVSATDDLQAMRPEMEEAGGRDALGNPHHGRFLASADGPSKTFALPAARYPLRPETTVWGVVVVTSILPSTVNWVTACVGRAPPFSFLG